MRYAIFAFYLAIITTFGCSQPNKIGETTVCFIESDDYIKKVSESEKIGYSNILNIYMSGDSCIFISDINVSGCCDASLKNILDRFSRGDSSDKLIILSKNPDLLWNQRKFMDQQKKHLYEYISLYCQEQEDIHLHPRILLRYPLNPFGDK